MAGVCYSTVLSFLGAYTAHIGITGIGATGFFLCFAATSFISRPLTGYLLDHFGGNIVIYPALICSCRPLRTDASGRRRDEYLLRPA